MCVRYIFLLDLPSAPVCLLLHLTTLYSISSQVSKPEFCWVVAFQESYVNGERGGRVMVGDGERQREM